MKIYEKPSVEIRTFDVEDVMSSPSAFAEGNELFDDIAGTTTNYDGVVFEW